MNNNRGNNRRRGRGNNRPQGGGQQLNRIDSRARGNAPQLLEKYKKLAHDAHLNGDRVTAEYYLQFADHYFRVIADTRVRQEEQRLRHQGGVAGDRWQDQSDEGEESGEFTVEGDFPSFEQPSYNRRDDREPRGESRGERENRPDREPRPEREPRAERENRGDRENRGEREGRENRFERRPREDREPRAEEPQASDMVIEEAEGGQSVYEPVENPFVREGRGTRGLRPRREDRRPRRDENGGNAGAAAVMADGPVGFDASVLPPAIGVPREEAAVSEAPVSAEATEAAPAPKRRTRKPKAAAEPASEG